MVEAKRTNHEAERRGDWTALAEFYTPDAVYEWNMGPHQEFVASGRQEIGQVALGYHMKGFEDWKYPYREVFIDEKRGTVIAFWDQVAPCRRSDGTPYQVDGVGGSRFDYAGEFQWRFQRDFFDLGNTKALLLNWQGLANWIRPFGPRFTSKHEASCCRERTAFDQNPVCAPNCKAFSPCCALLCFLDTSRDETITHHSPHDLAARLDESYTSELLPSASVVRVY